MTFRYLASGLVGCAILAAVVLAYLLAFIALIATFVLPIRQFGHHYDINDCRKFSAQSGYETKFAEYSWFTWECLVKTDNGKWVSKDNLHGVNQ